MRGPPGRFGSATERKSHRIRGGWLAAVLLTERWQEQGATVPLMRPVDRRDALAIGIIALGAAWSGRVFAAPARANRNGDFDFLFGRWTIQNRRLKKRNVSSTEWEKFESTLDCRPVLDGTGNVDEYETAWGGGIVGASLRLFDPVTGLWSDYWVNRNDGILGPPMVGSFESGVGRFEGVDSDGDRAVWVRAAWSGITKSAVNWEQAFSYDEGRTWETNWRMQMARIER